ncbi:CDF family Co(II)/Ni(II) efflux transporter DmeF [Methylomonas methanica]|uniref:Cation diffusion facilitator family transporter n=1 Tax=Methylomonas methanica (strain DSM 25384 / MC09) TaxID=857087 RepID=F9ZX61_METMM|nr:CDF family Co(II)/Ni(II) efflux transporter DmeF [Methylomonas methanica]AEF99671.1 cation diffusion facilitator family transporter [Methylomonas methanica MC09]
MHKHQLNNWQHTHNFARINRKGEKRTKWVLVLTFTTMLVEIVAGTQFHSMALLADGWHMATHVMAFMIAIFAYRYSRIHEQDQTFAFSPAKVSVLGGFASSVSLAVVACMMIAESAERLISPQPIQFDDAILVAVAGLVINLLSALLLSDHHHDHHHEHHHAEEGHEHHEHHHDHNLRAAYMHVVADALTSVLAIVALLAGKYYGWNWLDTVMGFVGAFVILVWAWGLIKETSPILLDQGIDEHYLQAIQDTLEDDGECRVSDIHIWRVSPAHHAAIIVLVTRFPKSPNYYKNLLASFVHLDHITIEVNACKTDACVAEDTAC